MKKFAFAVAIGLASIPTFGCPLTQSLAEHYGISFSGFTVSLPETSAPDLGNGNAFVRVMMLDQRNVPDGFRHTVLMNTTTKKVWILRTSGFIGVYQWFGPVDAVDPSLEHCRLEPMPVVLKSR